MGPLGKPLAPDNNGGLSLPGLVSHCEGQCGLWTPPDQPLFCSRHGQGTGLPSSTAGGTGLEPVGAGRKCVGLGQGGMRAMWPCCGLRPWLFAHCTRAPAKFGSPGPQVAVTSPPWFVQGEAAALDWGVRLGAGGGEVARMASARPCGSIRPAQSCFPFANLWQSRPCRLLRGRGESLQEAAEGRLQGAGTRCGHPMLAPPDDPCH